MQLSSVEDKIKNSVPNAPKKEEEKPKEPNDSVILSLYSYSLQFEKLKKIPCLSILLDLSNLFSFKMGSKLNLKLIHIASLSYFQQCIQGMKKEISYAELIQKLNTSGHDQNDFNINCKILSMILGVDQTNAETYRTLFLSRQYAILSREVENDIFPESKKDMEDRIKELFQPAQDEQIEIPIDLDFILQEYEECSKLLKTFLFHFHKYAGHSITATLKALKEKLKVGNYSDIYSNCKNYSIEKYGEMKNKIGNINILNKEFFSSDNFIYKNYIKEGKLNTQLVNYAGKVFQPFSKLKIYVSDNFVKIKTDLTTTPKEIKDNLIDFIKKHCEEAKDKFGKIKLKIEENFVSILIQKKFTEIANLPWMTNLIGTLSQFYKLEAIANIQKKLNEFYLWIKPNGSLKEKEETKTDAERKNIEMKLMENQKKESENKESENKESE
ncbi:MAG: hypothetical protein MJ252_05725 [archaeon]|nr:hypothetical protein [archaeon]